MDETTRLLLTMAARGQRVAVQSSDLESLQIVEHADDTCTLEVRFRSGGLYRYAKVPPKVVFGIIESPSAGKFFHANVKNKYEFARVQ